MIIFNFLVHMEKLVHLQKVSRDSAQAPREREPARTSFNNRGVLYERKGDLVNSLVQHQEAREVFLAVHGQEALVQ